MGVDDVELFRVVQRFPRSDGTTAELAYGPYRTVGAARAARGREQRLAWFEDSWFTIERASVVWEEVQ